MDTALLIQNRVNSCTGICTKIISDRDHKINSEVWKNLHQSFGTKLSFSIDYHPQTDALAEGMIQTLEDIVRIFCEHFLELKYCDGFTNYWFTPLPSLELEYKTAINVSTNQTPDIIEKGLNPRLTHNSLWKYLV
ncbi:hypothetical protein O181_102806 [Austropuccinia psidii MF-1]|uniref:Integrase catalytic domain-containing protein n=1 Tax=Austropuccinia psidii MF-1 TaxID=1389203 RepID=A0A9Q3PJX0_9BASI|nr:hypothetical protein [Austropuccinia psidii MF-1]